MVNSIIQKANARLRFWFRKQKFLNLRHFDYACSFWYPGLSKLLGNRLQVTQNKMIRFVLKLDPRSHLELDEFKSLGWLPVSKIVDQIIQNHIFKIKSGTSPESMNERFIPASFVHSYSTILRENGWGFSIPKAKGFSLPWMYLMEWSSCRFKEYC